MGAQHEAAMAKTPKKKATLTRRSMPADDQEARSVGQFMERLALLGWKPQGPRKDYGEDYLVQIWDDGVPSGLSFYVQLKSITNAEKRKGKRDSQTLHYKLEVKDIDHWAAHAVPVVLVIWDVQARVGYWQTIRRVVEGLEKEKPKWRQNVHVTVNVPVANTTNDEGMGRLRLEVVDYMIPLFNAHGSKIVEITMSETAFNTVIAGWDRGQRVILRDDLTPTIKWPEWHQRLFQQRGKTVEVQFGAPQASTKTALLRVEVRVGKSIAVIPNVELRQIGTGIRKFHFSNEHQKHPLLFSIEGEVGSTLQFKFRRVSFGRTILEAHEVTEFVYLANQPDGLIRVIEMASGQIILEKTTEGGPQAIMMRLEEMHDVMKKLVEIEPFVSKFGMFDLKRGITEDDIETIEILHEALTTGKVELEESFALEVMPEWPEFPATHENKPILKDDHYSPTLFGLELPIRVRDTVVDSAEFLTKLRLAHEQARKTQKPVVVNFDSLRIVRELCDTVPPNPRLQDLATTQSGYFTLRQALDVGFTSAEQLEIHERVERCGNGVYRFKLHPASEHEDLVITWLQTEKQGVFSHDTALALHEFSDILPARLHITVPPEWKPVEGMELAPNVVVHHGSVAPTEMDWMGPVPFTKPLRTIEDCIRDHLSPDLLEQAIANAYRRGILTPENRLALQTQIRKSA